MSATSGSAASTAGDFEGVQDAPLIYRRAGVTELAVAAVTEGDPPTLVGSTSAVRE